MSATKQRRRVSSERRGKNSWRFHLLLPATGALSPRCEIVRGKNDGGKHACVCDPGLDRYSGSRRGRVLHHQGDSVILSQRRAGRKAGSRCIIERHAREQAPISWFAPRAAECAQGTCGPLRRCRSDRLKSGPSFVLELSKNGNWLVAIAF